jgi:pimeloyl-ACP methyl ester carboxylesterase
LGILWGIIGLLAGIGGALALWSLYITRRIEKALPALGQWVEVAGGRIHYVEMGPADAPPLVMIHGILAQLRHFSYGLAERFAEHRVILIDRPGWGYSMLSGARPGIGRQADMIAEALTKLGAEKPLVVGHSMGGAVSLALALRHPALARGFALIAPYTQPVAQLVDTFRSLEVPALLRPIIAWTLAVPMGIKSGPKKAAQVFSPDPVPADFATRGGGLLALRPASFSMGSFEVSVANVEVAEQAARYGEIAVPVAILHGRGDYLLDPALHGAKTVAAIPGAKLTLIEGGHMPLICRVDEVEAWLRAVAG